MSRAITKAVLLAAGRGTRMRELTNELPKPMIAVRGKPILQHIIEGCAPPAWRTFFSSSVIAPKSLGKLSATARTSASGSITRPRWCRMAPGRWSNWRAILSAIDPFVLSYGDIMVDPINYPRLTTLDEDTAAIVSVKRNEDVSKGGAVFVNERFELIDLREKPQPGEPTSPWYNAGIYAFRPSIFDFTARLQRSPRGEYELTDAIRDLALSGKKVQALS